MGDRKEERRRWDSSLDFTVPEVDLQAFPIACPTPIEEMDWVSRRWTVCQILRELYHAVEDPRLKVKCRVASTMTKEMIAVVVQHDPEWGKHRWPWREKQIV